LTAFCRSVLNDLERNVNLTRDRVDWVAKEFLLNELQEEEKLSWSDPWLQSIDLEYPQCRSERGLYYEFCAHGSMRARRNEDRRKTMVDLHPPETTRAFFRWRVSKR